MNDVNTDNTHYKYIKVKLSIDEYQTVRNRAEQRKLSMQEYAKMKLMDDLEGLDSLQRQIMVAMPHYYNEVDKISDIQTKEWFRKWGGSLCQLLK